MVRVVSHRHKDGQMNAMCKTGYNLAELDPVSEMSSKIYTY